jgi:hypothetical protein
VGVKPTTVNKELAALSGFVRWAHEHGYCERMYIKRFPLIVYPLGCLGLGQRNEQILTRGPRRQWCLGFEYLFRISMLQQRNLKLKIHRPSAVRVRLSFRAPHENKG